MDLRKIILSAFKSGKLENKTQNEIISSLHLPPSYKKPAKAVIKNLSSEGLIIKVDGGKYVSPEKAGAFYATVKANAGGYAFLIPDGYKESFVREIIGEAIPPMLSKKIVEQLTINN